MAAAVAGIVAGAGLAAMMMARLVGLARERELAPTAVAASTPIGRGMAATSLALLASIALVAAGVAVAGALLSGVMADTGQEEYVGAAPEAPPPAAIPDVRAGRRITSDPSQLGATRELLWPVFRMHVAVPADWAVHKVSETDLEVRHPTAPTTFLVAHATPMPVGPTFEEYLEAHLGHARAQFEQGLIAGYATKRIGSVPGVITIEHRPGEGLWTITWRGFQPAELGSVSVTILAGAAEADFGRDEPLLGALVDAIRFE